MSDPQQPGGTGWGPVHGGEPPVGSPPPGPQGLPPSAPPPPGAWQGTPQDGRPAYGQPAYGAPQYGQVPYGAAPYGQPAYGPPGAAPWRPVEQRGIVPLRPLGLGEIYDGAFRAVRSNPRVMFGVSAVVVAVAVVVQVVAQALALGPLLSTLENPDLGAAEFDVAGAVSAYLAYSGTVVVAALAVSILSGLLIISVSRSVIGETVSIAEFWALARGRVWRLLGLTLVLTGAVAVAVGIWIALLVATVMAEQWAALAAVGILGGLALVGAALWFSVRTLLSTPALVLENLGVFAGLARGWRLSRGSFWRLLGIWFLTQLIVGFVSQVIVAPPTMLVTALVDNPLTDPVALLVTALTTLVAQCLTVPFVAGVTALLYIDLRIRREGLDVELARAAEAVAEQPTAP